MKNNFYIRSLDNSIGITTNQTGFSLIEVMIAALVLSIGILGVASLQVVGLKGTHQSSMKVQAMTIVHSLTERMHANKVGVSNGSYVDSSTDFVCGEVQDCNSVDANCNSADIAKIDLDNLICGYKTGTAPRVGGIKSNAAGDQTQFVDGQLDVTCPSGNCSTGQIQISMQWQEQRFGKEGQNSSLPSKDSLVVNTRIFK